MKPFDYAIATTPEGAIRAADSGYAYKASGIDMLDMLKERTTGTDKIVSLHRLDSLAYIREKDNGVALGAMTTLRQLGENPLLLRRFSALAEAAGDAATPQVRTRATVGGNILQRPRCWFFRANEYNCLKMGGSTCFAVDGENSYHALYGGGPCHITHPSNVAPVLVAGGAILEIQNSKETRNVPAEEFFVLPRNSMYSENVLKEGELLSEVFFPALPQKSGYMEFRQKQSFDWPLAAATVVYTGEKWSVVLSHVAPIPWRASKAEEVLGNSADIDNDLAEKAAEAALDGAEPMRQNAWRLRMVRAAVRRALLKACGKDYLA